MNDQRSGLGMFHPHIAAWFAERIGRPTPTQRRAWTQIAAGDHLLVTAPTGSGKTLAAFLWALNQLVRETWASGATQVLYISPLKALNNDIRRNLTTPLEELRQTFVDEGLHFPPIRVNTRSGDTPPYERRQMIRRPPEILITTPESLHLMLSSQGGRSILGDLRTVILDEVHAVVGSKRGTLLMSAVERLVPLSGEFQRIALSATVNPEAAVADFVGGFRLAGDVGTPAYIRRPVKRCRSMQLPRNTIFVRIPDAVVSGTDQRSVWEKLSETLGAAIAGSRSTIIFTNSRRLCEKLTFLINAGRAHPLAYAHHGSLSRELRLEVEQRLKNGDLKAIVATASLELGIDVGSLDHVIMVQS
ncbi:MAG TPA: DEAD/DEAH box helicase, partial [Desulfosarcina sp.]|nr:DEAD/DEAH box helicase [Desulfosarcina sp.]